ncbi:DUF6603 domain-containing protein [Acrocarpospora catenulata]|uniref:DUF6603 domain-containing protein n=1 Tax=Acrocarpospora catenulata TaxID=2836182 RepID=UPI001BD97998|nr:DUF6603 domain-containing protein [Acrocarpospora catenulata]
MTPDDIRVTGGLLDLDVTGLVDPAFFPTGRLTLTGAVRTEAAGTVTVTGTGSGLPYPGMAVTAVFEPDGDDLTATVTARAAADWTMGTAFPDLGEGLMARLTFTSATLTLTSGAERMGVEGVLDQDRPPLFDLLVPVAEHRLRGSVGMVSGLPDTDLDTSTVPDVILYGPSGASLNMGLFTMSELRYEIYGEPQFSYDILDWEVLSHVEFTGAIQVGGRRVLISAEVRGREAVQFSADFSDLGPLGVDTVAALANLESLPTALGPQVSLPVLLNDVTFTVDSSGRVPNISLTLAAAETWTVGGVTFSDIQLTFAVSGPMSEEPEVTGMVYGEVTLGEAGRLEAFGIFGDETRLAIGLPDPNGGNWDEDAELPVLRLDELYTFVTGDSARHLPVMEVTQLHLELTLPRRFSGVVEVNGDWTLIEHVELRTVHFQLDQDDSGTTFVGRGHFVIGGVPVIVEVDHFPDPTPHWRLSGATRTDARIPIGRLFDDLTTRYGGFALPEPLAGLVLSKLSAEATTGDDGGLRLAGRATFPVDGRPVVFDLRMDTVARLLTTALEVTLGDDAKLSFGLGFRGALMVGYYAHTPGGTLPTVKELVAAISPQAGAYVPDGLVVDLRDAYFAEQEGRRLVGADLTATIDLSKLPLAGPMLPPGPVGFAPLRMISVSGALDAAAVNGLLPSAVPPLPGELPAGGFVIDGKLLLGPLEESLRLPVDAPPPAGSPASPAPSENVLWYKVQRGFGPVHIARIGLAYREGRLFVLVDAALTVAGLTLSLNGLAAGLSLSDPLSTPTFDLAGLGISYTGGPLEVTGAFLHGTLEVDGVERDSFNGLATLKTADLSIAALGSYVQLPSGPSLFVYAFVDYPLGGPSFFYVRGLAAGFGYNRRVELPPVEQVAGFPLVAEATGRMERTDLAGEVARLSDALTVSEGDYFLAVGVHFTTYEMIDSFLLLSAVFGHRFALQLVGLSTLTLPAESSGKTPIAQVQIALRATLVPEDGYFSLVARLTPGSFVLSRDCVLTGGFAFASWFGEQHSGDFVLTAGGYHPRFPVPAHYPQVPRLAFNWKVDRSLTLKGTAYYALTPSALMAGGSLNATWHDGSLKAWFDASMDFLIGWHPYHYDASFHISVGASYTFHFFGTHTITAHVGADVQLWGPEFSGRAHIDLSVVSFTISFGARAQQKPTVSWSEVRNALLPSDLVTVVLGGGALRPGEGEDLGLVDPGRLTLTTDSVIPSTRALAGTNEQQGTAFGVAPTGDTSVTATHRVTITRDGEPAEHLFTFEPVRKDLPFALWGTSATLSLNHPQLVSDLLTGYTITPLPPIEPGQPATIDVADLQATPLVPPQEAIWWTEPDPFIPADGDPADLITTSLTASDVAETRAALLDAVLPGTTVDLAGFTVNEFFELPEVAYA